MADSSPRLRAPARRRQLLDAALPRFAQGGYRGTTTAQLAEAAGITAPILYRHFDSKLELFLALIDEAGGRVRDAWQAAIREAHTPETRRRAMCSGPGPQELPATRILMAALVEAPHDTRIRAACRRQLGALQRALAAEVRKGQRAGLVRSVLGADAAAKLLVSVWTGNAATGGNREGVARALETLLKA